MKFKIVSGGQTGIDQAALAAAVAAEVPYSGWIPKGRRTEAGTLDAKYAVWWGQTLAGVIVFEVKYACLAD